MMKTKKYKPKVEDHILDRQEDMMALWKAAKDIHDYMILVACRFCGMRDGELSHMKKTWWDGSIIRIPKNEPCSCSECRKRQHYDGLWYPKTDRGARMIPVNPAYRNVIDTFFNSHQEFGISRIRIWQRLKAMQKRAGVKGNVFPHALRGTYITDLLGKGVPDSVVAELVGHKNIATTSGYKRFSRGVLERILKEKAW